MPDASGHERHSLPPRWSDAFAALPLDAAPPQAWERLRARLPAKPVRVRGRWPLWLAAAASLAAVGMLSMPMWGPSGNVGSHSYTSATPATSAAVPPVAASPNSPVGANPIALVTPERTAQDSRSQGNSASRSASTAAARERPREEAIAATATSPRRIAPSRRARPESNLEPLYAESAQLEALLAVARDDRIASSGAAALTDSLDAELAAIDATLIQPGLDAPRRAGLWRQRVDTLRQLAGVETTRRLLSARGETYDAALVSID
ncbi:hypothetical protein H9L17_05475 [Thermomonas brevis]|uniref:Uncharacterized protein n=1 Tax=Thermomonas brevis TaxID=215691 RepID=A0A7G9QW65_9GAMM|nr:hypothetical protein [Thermomonas brevis]QNN47590.1 hypothetical protein H9L17_05475 [Thermomonas brevis]